MHLNSECGCTFRGCSFMAGSKSLLEHSGEIAVVWLYEEISREAVKYEREAMQGRGRDAVKCSLLLLISNSSVLFTTEYPVLFVQLALGSSRLD